MKEFKSVDEILDFAITAEQEAVDFYSDLASRSKNAQIKKVFVEFAGEEMRHKSRLLAIKEEKTLKLPDEKVRDMKIADYLVDVAPMPDMTYGEALILAMKKEKNAFRLYTYLSEEASDAVMKNLFRSLALEESRHKLKFELEYDEYILKEN
jgi:rubrerythrin